MRVLVTGHDGYIGCVLMDVLQSAGHDVEGVDTMFYHAGTFGAVEQARMGGFGDIRDVHRSQLEGFDAVIHLAALSIDIVGDLNPAWTYEINYRASVRLAELARDVGVSRFLFSSSCSLYGAGVDGLLDESTPFTPVTPYGESKIMVERDLSRRADDNFSPTFLRNATAYGVSPRFRGDIVVNNLVGLAFTTGEVRLQSNGTPWRPFVHVRDIAAAFLAILEAPREQVHNEVFNIGRTEENYQIQHVAEIVETAFSGSRITFAEHAAPDIRNYRVSFDKLASIVPGFEPLWTVEKGVAELRDEFERHGLEFDDLMGPRYQRIARLKQLLTQDQLDDDLRWRSAEVAAIRS